MGIPMKNLLSEHHQNHTSNPALDDESFLTDAISRHHSGFGDFCYSKFSGNELVELWREGSSDQRRASVRKLLERYEPSAFLVCNVLLESAEQAALACEDACVTAIGEMELETLSDVSAFRVILFRAVYRRCQNLVSMTTPTATPKFELERSTLVDLAGSDRWMLALRFFAELDKEEIESVMQMPSADVRRGLWNAMQSVISHGFYSDARQQSDTAA